jgi:hypothetical protein
MIFVREDYGSGPVRAAEGPPFVFSSNSPRWRWRFLRQPQAALGLGGVSLHAQKIDAAAVKVPERRSPTSGADGRVWGF